MSDLLIMLHLKATKLGKKVLSPNLPCESKKCPAFERLLLSDYINNDILQYLIK